MKQTPRVAGTTSEALTTVAILVLLVAGSAVSPAAYRYHPRDDTPVKKAFRTLKKRGLNREASTRQVAGYYEGLLDEAATVTRFAGRGLLDWRFWLFDRARRGESEREITRRRSDYLRQDYFPNLDVRDPLAGWRLVTNSMGLADKEYAQSPPEKTWRIALIGDSVSQGDGTDFGSNYESRLEADLNDRSSGNPRAIEIVNFSVSGYQLTHFVDVALAKAPLWKPNAYVIALTERSVFTTWANHLASLVSNRIDVKYNFLRSVVDDAQLTPNLSPPLVNARLARYRVPIQRWALSQMREQASREGAPIVVLLVPSADDVEAQIEMFKETKDLLIELAIPTVDVLETFLELETLAGVRVSAADRHPNREGHRMLYEAIRTRIMQDPRVWHAFTGQSSASN